MAAFIEEQNIVAHTPDPWVLIEAWRENASVIEEKGFKTIVGLTVHEANRLPGSTDTPLVWECLHIFARLKSLCGKVSSKEYQKLLTMLQFKTARDEIWFSWRDIKRMKRILKVGNGILESFGPLHALKRVTASP